MPEPHETNWNPEGYRRNARFVSDLGYPVLELLAPQPGERVLDLGCGDGALTIRLKEIGCRVVGVDASPEMVTAARARGLEAYVVRGEALPFESEFDAVFTNAALHWIRDQPAVARGVFRALVPGGRYVGEMGGKGNIKAVVEVMDHRLRARGIRVPSPWVFPGPEEFGEVLEETGFRIGSLALIPRQTPLPGGLGGWLETFAQAYLDALRDNERAGLIEEVTAALRPELCDAEGRWTVPYVRLRFSAVKPPGI